MADLSVGFLINYDWVPGLKKLAESEPDEALKLIFALIDRQKCNTTIPQFESEWANVLAKMIEPSIERRLKGAEGGKKQI